MGHAERRRKRGERCGGEPAGLQDLRGPVGELWFSVWETEVTNVFQAGQGMI